ncbi:MAG: sulfurtransferase TusA family protein [Halioglobus sp.]|nr:sulfurtransferase TusA family protein [Halioglobus sp.]
MSHGNAIEVDARGRDCPMPLLMAKRALNGIDVGQCVRVLATDQGSVRDFVVFAEQSGHRLVSSDEQGGVFIHVLEKA